MVDENAHGSAGRPSPLQYVLLAIPVIAGAALAVAASSDSRFLPIDDAYILRKYAINLASGLGWGFNPGEVSFGSTSFLFPVIVSIPLAIFKSLSYERVAWAFGVISFLCLIGLIEFWTRRESGRVLFAFGAGLLLAISPAGYMNAVSGMETATFALGMLGVAALYGFSGMKRRPLLLGVLSGIVFYLRPEGLFLAIALPGAEIVYDIRDGRGGGVRKYALFALGFLALAIPYIAAIKALTGGWLPTTYSGKIISTDPMMHSHGLASDLLFGVLWLFKGHWRSMVYYGAAGAVLWSFAAVGAALAIAGLLKRSGAVIFGSSEKAAWCAMIVVTVFIGLAGSMLWPKFTIAAALLCEAVCWTVMVVLMSRSASGDPVDRSGERGMLVLIGITLMPFAYGSMFRAGPIFGGYYNRYILPVLPALLILSMAGVGKIFPPSGRMRVLRIAAVILLFGYPCYLAAGNFKVNRQVYRMEARLNGGIRMEAARWIDENTPEDSVVLVGYTGLGVVGGFANRYVLDMGALINPDIFAYYGSVPAVGPKRWQRTLSYIKDREIDYFVTVPGLKDPSSDPSGEPGFHKVTTITDKGIRGRFSKIEIWQIDRSRLGN